MKLNHECVRDLLLTIESLEYGESLTLHNYAQKPLLSKYEDVDIVYTAERLLEAGFINGIVRRLTGNNVILKINGLTWDGHQFLDNIRDVEVWEKTKKAASKVASTSLTILADIAASVLKKTLGFE